MTYELVGELFPKVNEDIVVLSNFRNDNDNYDTIRDAFKQDSLACKERTPLLHLNMSLHQGLSHRRINLLVAPGSMWSIARI